MSWQADGIKKIWWRTIALGGILIACAFVLWARMFYLQIIESEKYKMLADKNRIAIRFLQPPRGLIYDFNGMALVFNRNSFRAVITAEDTNGKLKETLDKFSFLVPINEEERARILKEITQKKAFVPVRIRDDLSFEEMSSIQLNIPDLPGVAIEDSLMRTYPQGNIGAHVLGYVSFPKEVDFTASTNIQKMPDVRVGQIGIEQFYERQLYGATGIKKMETNAVGREVRELEKVSPRAGEDLKLTLDSRFQEIGYNAMGEESGAAILLEVETGQVKMMISMPSFDPNLFNAPIDVLTWNELNNNEKHPLVNKAISGLYSPGSIFKIVVALAALEAGVITENTKVQCEGKIFVGDHQFHCWRKNGHGVLSLKEAMQHSCDVYFYQVASKVGMDRIIDMASRLGFGEKTGIDLVGEKDGLLPTRAWKEGRYNEPWRPGDTMNLGIGQGYLQATPLQMVVMMARVANKKYKVKPSLVQNDGKAVDVEPLEIKAYYLNLVLDGLSAVVNEKGGTAFHARFDVDGEKMGGKTASTQIRRISLKEREEGIKPQNELPWKERDHAFFVAYAPLENPRYALIVAVEHGGGGSSSAAPIAKNIMKKVLELDKQKSQGIQEKDL